MTKATPAFSPNFSMTDERRARIAKTQATLKAAMNAAVDAATSNADGQVHYKLVNPTYWDPEYMPANLTPEALQDARIHELDQGAATLGAHGEVALEAMTKESSVRKINAVVSNGTGQDMVATTYRQFTTHNPQRPEEKIVIHGHTNLAFRQSFSSTTSDIGKEKATITANFTKAFGEA